MLVKQNQMRVPNPHERMAMLGFPPRTLDALQQKERTAAEVTAIKNSMAGNGFNLYSVMLARFIFLNQVLENEAAVAICQARSPMARMRLHFAIESGGQFSNQARYGTQQGYLVRRTSHITFACS